MQVTTTGGLVACEKSLCASSQRNEKGLANIGRVIGNARDRAKREGMIATKKDGQATWCGVFGGGNAACASSQRFGAKVIRWS